MAVDALLDLRTVTQSATKRTATGSGTAIDLLNGTSRVVPLWARFVMTACATSTSTGTCIFSIDHSDDNSTFYTLATNPTIATTTTDQTGIYWLPIQTSKRYIRETCTLTGTYTALGVGYHCRLCMTKDGA